MIVIQVPAGAPNRQIEVPEHKPLSRKDRNANRAAEGEGKKPPHKLVPIKRSNKGEACKDGDPHPGALHLRPGSTLIVTEDELEHLKAEKIALREVGKHKPKPVPKEKAKGDDKPKGKGDDKPKGGGGDKPK
jgi:hypothetical protein